METNILRVYDCKTESCQKIYENAPKLTDNLCQPCKQEWEQLQDYLSMMSVSFSVQHKLVRGLDYYNKTVFEFVGANLGAQNSFCGGGRYDHLVKEIGGKEDQPCVGAAIGIERLMLMLEPYKDTLPLPTPPALYAVLPQSQDQHILALLVVQELTRAGLCTDIFLENDSMKSMMRKANKLQELSIAVVIGSEEQQNQRSYCKRYDDRSRS